MSEVSEVVLFSLAPTLPQVMMTQDTGSLRRQGKCISSGQLSGSGSGAPVPLEACCSSTLPVFLALSHFLASFQWLRVRDC